MANQLATLGLRRNQFVLVNYHEGPIDSSDRQKNLISIVMWANNQKKGLLFFVIPENQKFQVVHNVYSLTKVSNHWEAGDGNGGYETYKEVGKFVTNIAAQKNCGFL